ncbi:hypothetical protein CEXT_696011 [Caerostris extrusa]|uniref:Uncharacterized protein n=1 Tax=Caerostris extrusa TaxID=172846 RepID=A0AAV4S3H3_CAEEX|nr:hypothetical protein CEXT_696011 [Caerostris extrusa]
MIEAFWMLISIIVASIPNRIEVGISGEPMGLYVDSNTVCRNTYVIDMIIFVKKENGNHRTNAVQSSKSQTEEMQVFNSFKDHGYCLRILQEDGRLRYCDKSPGIRSTGAFGYSFYMSLQRLRFLGEVKEYTSIRRVY